MENDHYRLGVLPAAATATALIVSFMPGGVAHAGDSAERGGMSSAHYTHYARYAHHYVYYPDGPIYYAPVRNAWFWRSEDRWYSGERLPVHYADHLQGGIPITLDTSSPFERHEIVERQHPQSR